MINLTELHERNKRWRAWMDANTPFKTPDTLDCLRYALTEAAEAMDVWLREKNQTHARNNERNHSLHAELADTAMMLLTAIDGQNLTPETPKTGTLDLICFSVASAVFRCATIERWEYTVVYALRMIANYPSFDLSIELDICHKRLAIKHGSALLHDGPLPWESAI
jgi:hypothetical protein